MNRAPSATGLLLAALLAFGSNVLADPPPLLTTGVEINTSNVRTTLIRSTGKLSSDVTVRIKNTSDRLLEPPLHAIVTFTPAAGSTLTGLTTTELAGGIGQEPYQTFFKDLSSAIGAGVTPGAEASFSFTFARPSSATLSYAVQVRGVRNADPVVSIGGPYSAAQSTPINFDASSSSDPDGDALTYAWDFGDGGTATGAAPQHAFAIPGLYTVRVTATDPRTGSAYRETEVPIVPAGIFALARTRTLDGNGHPLGAVSITQTGPDGSAQGQSDPVSGFTSLGGQPGDHTWTFAKPGHLTAHRKATLSQGTVKVIAFPWLASLNTQRTTLSAINATSVKSPSEKVTLTVPPGAFEQIETVAITDLHGQNLPLPLPHGWSPLAAFHLDMAAAAAENIAASVKLLQSIAATKTLVLARCDTSALNWSAESVFNGNDTDTASATLRKPGSYAIVIADELPAGNPVAAVAGEPLPAGTAAIVTAEVSAVGNVNPASSLASTDPAKVTATATVDFTNGTQPLPSGAWFLAEVEETYDLRDGRALKTPDYDATFYAYQTPGDALTPTATATFPLRPRVLFSPAELSEANIKVQVHALNPFSGGILTAEGGFLTLPGIKVSAPAGAVPGPSAAEARLLSITSLNRFLGSFVALSAFELNLPRLTNDAALTLTLTNRFTPDMNFVLARCVGTGSESGLQPVLRMASDAQGVVTSIEPASGPRLPGITGSGQYVLVQLTEAEALITGLVRRIGGALFTGGIVRVAGEPWLSLTNNAGAFFTLAKPGNRTVSGTDPADGNSGEAIATLADAAAHAAVEIQTAPTGPKVIATTPVAGESRASLVAPITIEFSEPIQPATFAASGLRLRDVAANIDVPGSVTLELSNRRAGFFPINPLTFATDYEIIVSSAIRDLQNLPIEGTLTFAFKTQPSDARPAGAQLVIYEPDAENIPQAILDALVGYDPEANLSMVVAHGSVGTADPEVPVILVNETTGETATVLSKPDGSFATFIGAVEQDFVTAVFVNFNGTRIEVPTTRQLFDNGQIGLYKYGGMLEAESDGGPVQIIIEPGTIPSRTKFKLDMLDINLLQQLLTENPPEEAKALTKAVRVTMEGDKLSSSNGNGVDISFPVTPEDLAAFGLTPEDDLTQLTSVLTIPTKIGDETGYLVIDKMEFENGRLVTHSPPFPGMELFSKAPLNDSAPVIKAIKNNLGQIVSFLEDHPEMLMNLERMTWIQFGVEVVGAVVVLAAGGGVAALAALAIEEVLGVVVEEFLQSEIGQTILNKPLILNPISASNLDLAMMPLIYAKRTIPTTFTGRTIAMHFNVNATSGQPRVMARAVPGALITISDVSGGRPFTTARPGSIARGQLFTVSAQDGTYAFAVPTPIGTGSLLIPSDPVQYAIRATHHSYPSQTANLTVDAPVSLDDPIVFGDPLFFGLMGGSGNYGARSPDLQAFHAPQFPAPGSKAELTVAATNGDSVPTITVTVGSVESLNPNATPPNEPLTATVTSKTSENVGDSGRVEVFEVLCATPSMVRLNITATTSGGASKSASYAIAFGGQVPASDNLKPSDSFDRVGPRVVLMDPPEGSLAWGPGKPIRLVFNETLHSGIRTAKDWVHLRKTDGTELAPLRLELSPDLRSLEIFAQGVNPDEKYDLSLDATTITDQANPANVFDQDPSTSIKDNFTASLRTAPVVNGTLSDIITGGGAVLRGIYGYVLERTGTMDGSVVTYDLSNPSSPVKAAEFSVPGFPRDLKLIPSYSFVRTPAGAVETRDLLVVVGGKLNAVFDGIGNFLGGTQYMWVIDISDPLDLQPVATRILTYGNAILVPQVQWSPPFLTYLESGSELTSVEVANLQEFILGANMTQADFDAKPRGQRGADLNGDGDFVDDGERLPLPAITQSRYAGHAGSFRLDDTNQRIIDYDWDSRSATLGVILSAGRELGETRLPDGPRVNACYRTLSFGGANIPRDQGSQEFAGPPRRVEFLFRQEFLTDTGPKTANLALVSVDATTAVGSDGQPDRPKLVVVDITNPAAPKVISSIEVSSDERSVRQIIRRSDGLLLVTLEIDALLIDPKLLGLPKPQNVEHDHPAIVGRIAGFGGGGHTIASDPSGLNISSLGSRNVVAQTAPTLTFVRMPGITPDATSRLLTDHGAAALLAAAKRVTELFPARAVAHDTEGVESTLDPPNPDVHAYVMVNAPGSAGESIDLSLECLNDAGYPMRNRGEGFAPVRAMHDNTLTSLKQQQLPCGMPIPDFKAHRLSDNPGSPNYNIYLSDPFALIFEGMIEADLDVLKTKGGIVRAILWSGRHVRATLDPELGENTAIGVFASQIDSDHAELLPGPMAFARSLPGDYLLGPNPPPINGTGKMPGTSGTMSSLNGETRLDDTDFILPSRRMPIVFLRFCNGQDLHDGIFGRGWDFNYNERIVEVAEDVTRSGTKVPLILRGDATSVIAGRSDLILHPGRGRAVRFKYAGSAPPPEYATDPLADDLTLLDADRAAAYYLPAEDGVFDMMARMKDGKFVLLQPDGTRHWFDPNGRLEKLQDRYEDNAILLSYNRRGELVRITDVSITPNRYLELGYYRATAEAVGDGSADASVDSPPAPIQGPAPDAAIGKVCRIKDYTDRDVLFEYDACGHLTKKHGVDIKTGGGGLEEFLGRAITEYHSAGKDEQGHSELANSTTGITRGSTTGTKVFLADSFEAADGDDSGKAKRAKGGKGERGNFTFKFTHSNTAESVKSSAQNGGSAKTTSTMPGNADIEHEFDKDGRTKVVRSKKREGTPPAPGEPQTPATETKYEYEKGLVKRVTYPEGNSVEYVYDLANPVLRSRANVLETIMRPKPLPPGAPLGAGPELPPTITTQYSGGVNNGYDPKYNFPSNTITTANGDNLTITLATGGKDAGKITHPSGFYSETQFNSYGQVTYSRGIDGVETSVTSYDARGFATATLNGNLTTSYEYSGEDGDRGLPTKITPPSGAAITLDYNEAGSLINRTQDSAIAKLSYDVRQRLVQSDSDVDSGKTLTETRTYLQNGFLKSVTLKQVETDGATADLVTAFTEDDRFRIQQIDYPGGQVRRFEQFDHRGRPHKVTFGDYVETYAFDLNGNQISVTRGSGEALPGGQPGATATDEMIYDGYDRVSETRIDIGNGQTEKTTIEYYDAGQPKVVKVMDRDGESELRKDDMKVDSAGRVTEVKRTKDQGTAVTTTVYDGTARKVTVTSPSGETITMSYNAAGQTTETTDAVRTTTFGFVGTNVKSASMDESIDQAAIPGTESFDITYNTYDNLNHLTKLSDNLGTVMDLEPRIDGVQKSVTNASGNKASMTLSLLGETLTLAKANGIEFKHQFGPHRLPSSVKDADDQGHVMTYDSTLRPKDQTLRKSASKIVMSDFDPRHNKPQMTTLPGGTITAQYDGKGRLTNRTVSVGAESRSDTFDHDSLDRPVSGSFPGGSHTYSYEKLGPLTQCLLSFNELSYTTSASYRGDGARLSITYPAAGGQSALVLNEARDTHGRLLSLLSDEPAQEAVIKGDIAYASAELPATIVLGNDAITRRDFYDGRKRLIRRHYKAGAANSEGTTLADVRYQYDPVGNVLARQYLHRAGRLDVFSYDSGERLTSAHIGARPPVDSAAPRVFSGFVSPADFPFTLSPGFYERDYAYDTANLDLVTSATVTNPDGFILPPFTATFGAGDEFLSYTTTDAVTRTTDGLGNVTSCRLFIREAGAAQPRAVNATLKYDGLSQLTQVAYEGSVIDYGYDEQGLLVHRRMTGPGFLVPQEDCYVWREGLLFAIFDRTSGVNRLKGRFFYGPGDSPVAADMDDGSGTLRRVYFLQENNLSVMAVADADGQLLERYSYDAFGQPVIEGPDAAPPVIHRVVAGTDGLLVEFSERVLPALQNPPSTGLAGTTRTMNGVMEASAQGGQSVSDCVLVESVPGHSLGTTIKVTGAQAFTGQITLSLVQGTLVDEAGNACVASTTTINLGSSPPAVGAVVFVSDSVPAPASLRARSVAEFPFLFHGQLFDYDTGLYYMRARFYDPATGGFLQRDPKQYQDSVNLYAGFAHNPTSLRDPTGASAIDELAEWASKRAGKAIQNGGEAAANTTERAAKKAALHQADNAIDSARMAGHASPDGSRTAPSELNPWDEPTIEIAGPKTVKDVDPPTMENAAIGGTRDPLFHPEWPQGPNVNVARLRQASADQLIITDKTNDSFYFHSILDRSGSVNIEVRLKDPDTNLRSVHAADLGNGRTNYGRMFQYYGDRIKGWNGTLAETNFDELDAQLPLFDRDITPQDIESALFNSKTGRDFWKPWMDSRNLKAEFVSPPVLRRGDKLFEFEVRFVPKN